MSPDTPEETEPAAGENQPAETQTPGSRSSSDPIVTDDFGPEIPITQGELDAIQTYLGSVLRELFSPKKPDERSEDV